MTVQEFKPGVYEHFKGGIYRALFHAMVMTQSQRQVPRFKFLHD